MKLQMKTAKERKRKETFNKHQAKNMKTNFLQAKPSREQFHLIRHSAALTESCQAFRSQRFRNQTDFSFPEKLQTSEPAWHWEAPAPRSLLRGRAKPEQAKLRPSSQMSPRRGSGGWEEFEANRKQGEGSLLALAAETREKQATETGVLSSFLAVF